MRKFAAAVLAAVILSLSGCGPVAAPQHQRYEATFLNLFDTVITVVGYADSEEAFTHDAQFIQDALERYHRYYDIYHDYEGLNNLKTINDRAGGAPVAVDRGIIDLLLEAKRMEQVTGGKTNVAMGSVLALWHTYREEGIDDPENAKLPPMADLEEAARHTDISQVIIDEAASTVRLADPAMRLDVGAIAKGYATQQVTDEARAAGITCLLLSVGGNVCALGDHDGAGKPWRVGVQDPEDSTKLLHTLELVDKTLVTSGSYQRYYTVDGNMYHHIIDPDTLLPAAYFLAVTVLAEDSGDADALSTALFNLPYEEGLALVESLQGVEAFWMDKNRTEYSTPGFQAAFSKR